MNPKVKWCCLRTSGSSVPALCSLNGFKTILDRQTTNKKTAIKTVAYLQPMYRKFVYQVAKYNKRMT